MIYYPFLGNGRTCNQITTPLVYDESLSVAQQIACLFGKIQGIDEGFVSTDEFSEFVDQLNAELDGIRSDGKSYTDGEIAKLDDKLVQLIADLQIGMLIWNVTVGKYTNNVEAMRDFFNDVTVHAITVDTLANMEITVDGLTECGLNVRGLAVFSGYLIGEDFTPEGIMYAGADVDIPLTTEILSNGMVRDGYFVMGKGEGNGE